MTKILIVGGVAGGASAAARARRLSEDAEIIMFERGPFVSFANCGLPYHIGGDIQERSKLLLQTPESFLARFNVDVRVMNEVVSINRQDKTVTIKNLLDESEYVESYDFLLLSQVLVLLFHQSQASITRSPTRYVTFQIWIASSKRSK